MNMSFGSLEMATVEISRKVSSHSDSLRWKRTHLESHSLMSAGVSALHSKVRQQLSANWRRMAMR